MRNPHHYEDGLRVHFAHSPPSSSHGLMKIEIRLAEDLSEPELYVYPVFVLRTKKGLIHTLPPVCCFLKSFHQRYFQPGSSTSRRMMNPEKRNPIKKIYSWSTLAPKVSGWINNVSVQVYDSKNDWRRCQSIVIASSDHERQIRDYVLMFLNVNTMIWFTGWFVWRKEKEEKMKNRSLAWSIWGREIELFSPRNYIEGFEKD